MSERELAAVLSADRSGQEFWYAIMLDRYHEMYADERLIKGKSRVNDDAEYRGLNKGRDDLHKQLERLGKQLGKTKDMVLADVMAREGNLGEYLLPEYGVLTCDQLDEDGAQFGGNTYDDVRRGRFVHAIPSATALENRRKLDEWRRENDIPERGVETRSFTAPVVGMPGEQEFSVGLRSGEAAIIFGNTFTVDIQQDPVEITPPGYPERVRRAIRAVETLRARGVNARTFMHTVGAYHDTVTVVGIAVPVDAIPVDVVGLLRDNRSEYGVRLEDMDARTVEEEYRAGLEEPQDGAPLWLFEFINLLSRQFSNDGIRKLYAMVENPSALAWSVSEWSSEIEKMFPKLKRTAIDEAMQQALASQAARMRERQQLVEDMHERFFGKR